MDQFADKAGGAVPDLDADEVARLQAIAAERGIKVTAIGQELWASGWSLTRAFPSTDALREWLEPGAARRESR
jgi:hypothetical protein